MVKEVLAIFHALPLERELHCVFFQQTQSDREVENYSLNTQKGKSIDNYIYYGYISTKNQAKKRQNAL